MLSRYAISMKANSFEKSDLCTSIVSCMQYNLYRRDTIFKYIGDRRIEFIFSIHFV